MNANYAVLACLLWGCSSTSVCVGDGGADLAATEDLAGADLAGADLSGVLAGADLAGSPDGGVTRPFALPTFGPAAAYPAGTRPIGVGTGDVDGDGKPDVVAINSNSVVALLGDGSGNLGIPKMTAAAHAPLSLVAFDASGDGKTDVIFTDQGSGLFEVTYLTSNGDGTFAPGATYFSVDCNNGCNPNWRPQMVAAGDVTGDGRTDVVVHGDILSTGTNQSAVATLVGTAAGAFRTVAPSPPNDALAADQLAIGDVDRDGNADVIVTGRSTAYLQLGDGAGSFGSGTQLATAVDPDGLYSAAIGDFDRDGKADALLGGSTAIFRQGKGNGTFGGPVRYASGGGTVQMVVGDLNGDGLPDVVLAAPSGHQVSILASLPAGGFAATAVPNTDVPLSVALADLDRDGKLDIVVADTANVTVYLNTTK